jgi:hypothetical protein
MTKKKTKRKTRNKPRRDVNQMVFDVITKVQISEHDAAKALGRKGGMARKAKLSLERLTEIGKQGAKASEFDNANEYAPIYSADECLL